MRVVWTRAVVAGFWFATAAYCLLSAIPFASEQFLKPGLVPALATFAAWHPWISLAALVAAGAGIWPCLRSGHQGARAFIAAWGLAAVVLAIAPPLSRLEPSPTGLALALLALVPPVWIALMDLPRARPAAPSRLDDIAHDVSRDFVACTLAALVVTITHAIAALPSVRRWHASCQTQRCTVCCCTSSCFPACSRCLRPGRSVRSKPDAAEAWLARCALAFALSHCVTGSCAGRSRW